MLVHRNPLFGRRLMLHAAGAAAVSHVVVVHHGVGIDDCAVDIGGVDVGCIHIDYGGVIGEYAALPLSAGKADAEEAAAVIYAAIVADLGTPVAVVEGIVAVVPAPVAGSP